MRIYSLAFILLIVMTGRVNAFSWGDLWQTKDKKATVLFQKGEYKKAYETFNDESWKAYAAYLAKDYDKAYQHYLNLNNYYNQGNALAFMGKYKESIDAYNQAIAINKQDKDAIYNKSIVEKLLKQQQKSQNQQNKNDKNQEKNKDKKKQQQKQDSKKQDSKKDEDKLKQSQNEKKKAAQKSDSQKEMHEQLLRLIPDDPGGLLREKFKRDYLRKIGG